MTKVSMTIDGVRYDDDVEPRMLLVHYLREVAGRTGNGTPSSGPSTNHTRSSAGTARRA